MKIHSFFLMLLMFSCIILTAQEEKNADYEMMVIHEDVVHPSMVMEYEAAAQKLVALLKKHNIEGADYMAVSTDDMRFMYVSGIENFADLDENPMSALGEKEGKEVMSTLWQDFDKCYDDHGNYVLVKNNKLSYMPEGIPVYDAAKPYRVFEYYHVSAQNYKALGEVASAFKDLAISKNSTSYYRVYSAGFGIVGNYYMVVSSAESPEAWERETTENRKLLGDDGKAMFGKALQLVSRMETVTGYIRPELSYSYDAGVADK